jgi:hypothetical protein
MRQVFTFLLVFVFFAEIIAQATNPVVKSFLQNKTVTGRHYVTGNSTPIVDAALANCQLVQYSTNWSYIQATGIPTYITGPFQDGNPSLATAQTGFFKLPLNPVKNTGTLSATTPGNIGVFINGVALYDYRDGVAWNPTTGALCGGPGNPMCPGGMGAAQDWNRDAIPAERKGFDCAKAHPAMGNYHHHQNPSAFNLDKVVVSTICDLYPSDGLYTIDSTKHSPLIGFAYDGFPIYGAYGYKNLDGIGGIVRIKSGYRLRNITTRTTSPTGTAVATGPPVSTTYPLGYFREDYEFVASTASDVLDLHNGRVCVTPEYPNGIYCYFATVDANWNSAYPYAVGPTFYGVKNGSKVTSVTEPVTTYTPIVSTLDSDKEAIKVTVYPNPAASFIAVQTSGLLRSKAQVSLSDLTGRVLQTTEILAGSTIGYFDIQTMYQGVYLVLVSVEGEVVSTQKVIIE